VGEYPVGVRYDAEELFCTKRSELLNFLAFAMTLCDLGSAEETFLGSLIHCVRNDQLVRVKVDGRRLIAHPVPGADGFIFQLQNDWYSLNKRSDDSTWLSI
jgi:hypothetical protein